MLRFSSAIIAGGKSTRFGSPKALAMFESKTFIDYAVDLASSLSDEVFVVYGEENHCTSLKNIISIQDEVLNFGPLVGIYTALKQAKNEYLVVLPCDMPKLNPVVYKTLQVNLPAQLLVAQGKRGLEPLVSIWHKCNIPLIEQAIKDKSLALKDFIKQVDAKLVYFAEEDFFNINYRADLDLI